MDKSEKPDNVRASLNNLVDETFCPGQLMDLGGVSIAVLDAPGHCLGVLAFWEPEKRFCFVLIILAFFCLLIDSYPTSMKFSRLHDNL
jgi:glyoxylase-like metal-dependent hydrolase (beta-lactamase superfamily II)